MAEEKRDDYEDSDEKADKDKRYNDFFLEAGGSKLNVASLPEDTAEVIEKFKGLTVGLPKSRFVMLKESLRKDLMDKKVAGYHQLIGEILQQPDPKKGDKKVELPEFLKDPEPWPHPVDGEELLDEITNDFFKRHLVLHKWSAETMALYVLHVYLLKLFGLSPYLRFSSATIASGKSTAMLMVSFLLPRGMTTTSLTAPTIYRLVDQFQISLCLDEADLKSKESREILALLLGSYLKYTSMVPRVNMDKGGDFDFFKAWGGKVFAGTKGFPEAAESRSIEIFMPKKTDDDIVEDLFFDDLPEMAKPLKQKLIRFVNDNIEDAKKLCSKENRKTLIPKGLDSRSKNNWFPLFVGGKLCGERWFKIAQDASLALEEDKDEMTIDGLLFGIIKKEFSDQTNVFRDDIIKILNKNEDGPWGAYNEGKGMNTKDINKTFKRFKIKIAKTVSIGGIKKKGYPYLLLEPSIERHAKELVDETDDDPSNKVTNGNNGATELNMDNQLKDKGLGGDSNKVTENGGVLEEGDVSPPHPSWEEFGPESRGDDDDPPPAEGEVKF